MCVYLHICIFIFMKLSCIRNTKKNLCIMGAPVCVFKMTYILGVKKWFCVKLLYQKFIQAFIVFYPNPCFTLYVEYFCFTRIFFQWYWDFASIFLQRYSFCVLHVRISCWVSFGTFMFLLISICTNQIA